MSGSSTSVEFIILVGFVASLSVFPSFALLSLFIKFELVVFVDVFAVLAFSCSSTLFPISVLTLSVSCDVCCSCATSPVLFSSLAAVLLSINIMIPKAITNIKNIAAPTYISKLSLFKNLFPLLIETSLTKIINTSICIFSKIIHLKRF